MHLAKERFGRVDVIFLNAGLMPTSPVSALKTDEWNQAVDINIKGVLNGVAAVMPSFIAQKSRTGDCHLVRSRTQGLPRRLGVWRDQDVRARSLRRPAAGGEAHNIRTTVISPGAVATELPNSVTDPETAARIRDFYAQAAIPADSFARVVAFAISQPDEVDINEILFARPSRLCDGRVQRNVCNNLRTLLL